MANKEIKRPNFFIVGAPKCGTTSMYEYLRRHPDIYMPDDVKEPHYFCTDFASFHYIRDLDAYLSLFSKAKKEKRIGEASATYLRSEKAAEGIKRFSPEAKIIIMLRNPVDMLYSLHSQFLYDGNEDIEDFEFALQAEADRKKGLRIPRSKYPPEFLVYRKWIAYAEQVRRYIETFGRENIYVILFDDFQKDTAGVYAATLRFLDVDERFTPDFRILNPSKRSKSKLIKRYLEAPPVILQKIVRAVLSESAKQKVFNAVERSNIIYRRRKPLNLNLKLQLQHEFKQEVDELSQLLGRNLRHWVN